MKDLIGIKELSRQNIEEILNTAKAFKEVLSRDIKKVPTLRGKTAINLFFEPSTRTRTSFELAEKRLSLDVLNFSISTSSVVKGETLYDTLKTIEAYNVDYIVIRHSSSGAAKFVAEHTPASVINAGDGTNEHPTQALLDAFSILEVKGRLDGLKIAIVGDIIHSRVARSNLYLLSKFDTDIRFVGPPTLLPEDAPDNVKIFYDLKKGIKDADVVMLLRIQLERQKGAFIPSLKEYFHVWGLKKEAFSYLKNDVIIMHPGPMNRGVEISTEVADSSRSIILRQVTNGIATRMAVIYLLTPKEA
ncbi:MULTISPECIES: aspartate carbamoyltransferase catalytic subunit [Thermodesulfovibrio]|jgi:aspartate carbamoyltransferase catalytic subunit|uniref:Aspartate carbamoyltransferase n=1 Tax=Thermodesulfovibrio yellowstonii (strain ATCC 51303 / DSM 11347 / YP87) TaxID=289376 RepID=B5YLE0_THEYD|nr:MULTISPECIES: aspartate carbamoyltransferase catalytic subunit [Thermodesulfovibrio]ACI21263.1 aspartate carbamoyltransferase [Thermodesulfovibrio yellowstonii DSM 11347]MDI6864868.1 aspartate carbamoyltransferase catalytic subunit [Thermodesulfovibrio yellowstonii]